MESVADGLLPPQPASVSGITSQASRRIRFPPRAKPLSTAAWRSGLDPQRERNRPSARAGVCSRLLQCRLLLQFRDASAELLHAAEAANQIIAGFYGRMFRRVLV